MKKVILILMSFLCVQIAEAKKNVTTLPSPDALAALNDSLSQEGQPL